jgi:hypothetical protein
MSKAGIIGELEIDKINAIGSLWTEDYKSLLTTTLLSRYKSEIIRTHGISDIVINGDKILIQWYCRMNPLTDEELLEKWGRDVTKETENENEN